jgi:hypothetical protein
MCVILTVGDFQWENEASLIRFFRSFQKETSKNQGTVMIATHKKKLCRRGAEYAKGKTKVFYVYSAARKIFVFRFLEVPIYKEFNE